MKPPAIELITELVEASEESADLTPPAAALLVNGTMLMTYPGGAVIGGSQACDIVLDLPSVSCRHGWIRPSNGRWAVQDIGATNATRLNAVLEGAQWLRHGDVLRLGRAQAKFVVEGATR